MIFNASCFLVGGIDRDYQPLRLISALDLGKIEKSISKEEPRKTIYNYLLENVRFDLF